MEFLCRSGISQNLFPITLPSWKLETFLKRILLVHMKYNHFRHTFKAKQDFEQVAMDFKLSSEDLQYLATHTDVPRAKLQEFYDQFVEEFSDGKITKEAYKNLMRV